MILSHPLALVGLVAAATPVVIYLLLRRRKTEVPWGASYLLRLTLTQKRTSSIWKQIVVLVVRCLVIVLGAMLLAHALLENHHPRYAVPAMPPSPVHRVVLVDNSMSMSVTDGPGSRWRRLREVLEALLSSQRPGDRMTLVPLLEGKGPTACRTATIEDAVSHRRASQILARILPREGTVSLQACLATSFTHLAATPHAEAELYVLSDFPRELAGDLDHLGWFRNAADKRQVRLVPVNMVWPVTEAQHNVVIRQALIGADLVIAGIPVSVHVEACNHDDKQTGATFELRVDGASVKRTLVTFKPNETKRFSVPLAFTRAGPTHLEIATDASPLEAHGTRSLSLVVRDKLGVWVVAEQAATRAQDDLGEAEFLLRALRGTPPGPPDMTLRRASLADLTRPIPDHVDVVVLAGPHFGVTTVAEHLEAFVRRGGGLVVAMSKHVGVQSYNRSYARLLPGLLAGPAHPKTDPDTFSLIRTEPGRGASPLLAELAHAKGADLSEVRLYNYMRLADRELDEGVVFRLGNDAPLLVQRMLGRGWVYLFTSSLGISWTSLPVRQCFVPLVFRVAHAAMSGRVLPRNLQPGQRLVMRWPGAGPVTMTAPDLTETSAEVVQWNKRSFVVIDGLVDRGLYRLQDTSGRTDHFTIRGTVSEGDLRTLADDQRRRLAGLLGAPIHADWPAAVKSMGTDDAFFPMWPWVLALMLVLYVFETWFVRYV